MPWISMTQEEGKDIVRTLQERGKENHLHGISAKQNYMILCQRCHAARGDGLGTIHPNLAYFPRASWRNFLVIVYAMQWATKICPIAF